MPVITSKLEEKQKELEKRITEIRSILNTLVNGMVVLEDGTLGPRIFHDDISYDSNKTLNVLINSSGTLNVVRRKMQPNGRNKLHTDVYRNQLADPNTQYPTTSFDASSIHDRLDEWRPH